MSPDLGRIVNGWSHVILTTPKAALWRVAVGPCCRVHARRSWFLISAPLYSWALVPDG